MTSFSPLETRLRDGLRAAADALPEADPVVPHRTERPERRRPTGRLVAAGAGLAVAAAALSLVFALGPTGSSGRDAAAAYTLEVDEGGRIHVTMHQNFDDASRLADDLRAAGVRVRVLPHPAHPLLAGTVEFPSHQLDDNGAVGIEEGNREFWIDPARFDGEIEMLVYVLPPPGEEWQQAPSAFYPEEPLGGLPCALDGPLTTQELQDRARSVGIDKFRWIIMNPGPNGISTGNTAPIGQTDPAPAGEVRWAQRIGPDHLEVGVYPPDVVARLGPTPVPGMNLNVGEAPEPECTPELRARWLDR